MAPPVLQGLASCSLPAGGFPEFFRGYRTSLEGVSNGRRPGVSLAPFRAPSMSDRDDEQARGKVTVTSADPPIQRRKADHIALCASGEGGVRDQGTLLDQVALGHHALP